MTKKKVLLRIDPALHDTLRKWADDDFRSINAQGIRSTGKVCEDKTGQG